MKQRLTLDEYLKASGRTLEDLSTATGLHLSTLSRYRHGKIIPKRRNALLIRDATGGLVTVFGEDPRAQSCCPQEAA